MELFKYNLESSLKHWQSLAYEKYTEHEPGYMYPVPVLFDTGRSYMMMGIENALNELRVKILEAYLPKERINRKTLERIVISCKDEKICAYVDGLKIGTVDMSLENSTFEFTFKPLLPKI